LSAAEVDVGRREIVQALVIAAMIVVNRRGFVTFAGFTCQ
jgi:hypothetical protein